MEKALKELATDIKNFKKSQVEGDRFSDVMNQFISSATEQHELLNGMYKKMDSLYKDTAKFYAFDAKKYAMEEFFGDLKSFKDTFIVSMYT